MTTETIDYLGTPAALVTVAYAAHRINDRPLLDAALERLRNQFAISIRFHRGPDREGTAKRKESHHEG